MRSKPKKKQKKTKTRAEQRPGGWRYSEAGLQGEQGIMREGCCLRTVFCCGARWLLLQGRFLRQNLPRKERFSTVHGVAIVIAS